MESFKLANARFVKACQDNPGMAVAWDAVAGDCLLSGPEIFNAPRMYSSCGTMIFVGSIPTIAFKWVPDTTGCGGQWSKTE